MPDQLFSRYRSDEIEVRKAFCLLRTLLKTYLVMASDSAARYSRPGLSLYANLLDPSSNAESAPGTISRAPIVFKRLFEEDPQQDGAAAEKQQINAG